MSENDTASNSEENVSNYEDVVLSDKAIVPRDPSAELKDNGKKRSSPFILLLVGTLLFRPSFFLMYITIGMIGPIVLPFFLAGIIMQIMGACRLRRYLPTISPKRQTLLVIFTVFCMISLFGPLLFLILGFSGIACFMSCTVASNTVTMFLMFMILFL